MQKKLLTAAIALTLMMSLGACKTNNTSASNPNLEDSSASYRSNLARNGVHDGNSDTEKWQINNDWNTKQFTQDQKNNARNNNSLGNDLKNAGEKTKDSIENATRDMKNGVENAAKDTKNAVERMR